MSVYLKVIGKFRNGKEREDELRLSINRAITNEDLIEFNNRLEKYIYPYKEKFKHIKVVYRLSHTVTLAPIYRGSVELYTPDGVKFTLVAAANDINKEMGVNTPLKQL